METTIDRECSPRHHPNRIPQPRPVPMPNTDRPQRGPANLPEPAMNRVGHRDGAQHGLRDGYWLLLHVAVAVVNVPGWDDFSPGAELEE